MRVSWFGATLLSFALPFAPLAAQDHAQAHGRLGVMLDTGADSGGARVQAVLPDGPAAAAGLRRGDVITEYNGTPLGTSDKLVELTRNLQPGDSVRLQYRRGSESRTATVVADRMKPRMVMSFHRMPGLPGMHGAPGRMGDMAPGMNMVFRFHHPGGLQLVPVGKDLGEYFGTSEGFLVVKPPADSTSPLKAGDVLLAVDGRKLQSVPHALGILHSYAPGEKAKIEVMRKKQRTTLTWTAPARHHGPAWRDGSDRSEGPDPEGLLEEGLEPADLFDLELPPLEPALGLGET